MDIKRLIGHLLLALIIIGMAAGIVYIFHFLGGFALWLSILFTLGIYVFLILLILLMFLISNLIAD